MRNFLMILSLSLTLLSCGNKDENKDTQVASEDATKTATAVKDSTTAVHELVYSLGEDYSLLDKPYATENNTQVVIYEFFGYSCPHCFHFQPFMEKWLNDKPEYTKLQRIPLNFQPSWAVYQQAYLTAEAMGIVEKSHNKLFDALHKQHKKFRSIDELANWYADEAGVDKAAFLSTADSFILDSNLRKADKTGFQMQITSTPTIVINGKYKISTKIRNRDEVLNIINFLAKKEAKAMNLID